MVEKMSDEIVKSSHDKRNYRYIKLKNQMECILVSDSESQTSAATLRVGSGYLKDPEGVNGLAHFCEHMLFMGTEKFPGENHYDKLIAEHAGYSNAFTAEDETVYEFCIKNEVFGETLDAWS